MDDPASMGALNPKYARVVLKLSGEGFGSSGKSGISIDDNDKLSSLFLIGNVLR